MSVAENIGMAHVAPSTPNTDIANRAGRPLLSVRDLSIYFEEGGRRIDAIKTLSYDVHPRSTLAIIGETGSGKSLACRAVLGVLPATARVTGSVRFNNKELLGLAEHELRQHRGSDVAMVFQDAQRSLNPTMAIGAQIGEAIRAHEPLGRDVAKRRTLDLLHLLRLPAPRRLFYAYPHELSGGMRQRVMIAVAIAAGPSLLIADEPTSSLDTPTGDEIMETLLHLQRQLDMALVLVSHDLRLVGNVADSVLVMQGGRAIEQAAAAQLLAAPQAHYTKALLDAIPSLDEPWQSATRLTAAGLPTPSTKLPSADPYKGGHAALLEVRNVVQKLPLRDPASDGGIRALCGLSFDVAPAEVLGVIGETGAGKTTLVRTLLQMPPPVSGTVQFHGHDLTRLRGRRLREHWSRIQLVFQEPYASLNPKWTVTQIVEEPLVGHAYGSRQKRQRRVAEVLDLVGLPPATYGRRRPGQLSGGECQRVAIARALALAPRLLICDEPLSSLDAVTQKQIVGLFRRLRTELGLAFLIISHDLARIREISDRILVLYLGQICEVGPAWSLCSRPFHPYTAALAASVSTTRRDGASRLGGDSPLLADPPSGCRFHTRCERAREQCAREQPELRKIGHDHFVACHFPIGP